MDGIESATWDQYASRTQWWNTHMRVCLVCQDGQLDDDIWRVATDCTIGSVVLASLKEIEIALGITPTNR